jgi:hypothetical protein
VWIGVSLYHYLRCRNVVCTRRERPALRAYSSVAVLPFEKPKALLLLSFAAIVLLGKFHISQEFGVHSSCAHMFTALGLFDTIGVSLLRIVVRASIL